MLGRIVRWSAHRPRLLRWACVWLAVVGGLYVQSMRIDLLPSFQPAAVTIETEAPGLVAEQVEETVTAPVETALLGAAGVAGVESRSMQGLSVVTVRFDPDADPARVRQAVAENLTRAAALPPGVETPRISPLTAPGPELLTIAFSSDKLDPMALRELVQWTVRPRLLSTAGVSQANIYGGRIRRIEVRARPGDLSDSDLGFLDILEATRRATAIAGAGFIDTPNQRVLIEPHGQAQSADDVGAGQIQTPGATPVRIADVADVMEAPAPAFGDALVNGKPAVLVVVDRALGADTFQATHAVEHALADLTPSLTAQGVSIRTDLDRPATAIAGVTASIVRDVAIGGALAALALALFMRDARVVLISLAPAPLALLAAMIVLHALGWTLNAMTLGGLAVALGLVIDDAVIDVEAILARLTDAERRHASPLQAVVAASLEVRGPIVYATVALVVSLIPLFLLSGPERRLLAPLALAIVAAALASALVALAVTPALAMIFLRHIRPTPAPPFMERLKARHGRWLERLARAPWLTAAIAGLATICAVAPLPLFRSELLPALHEGRLLIETDAPAATSLDEVRRADQSVTRSLLATPGVQMVSTRIGRDPTGDDGGALQHSVIDVALSPGLGAGRQDRIAAQARDALTAYPGAPAIVDAGPGAAQSRAGDNVLQVRVFGQDLDAVDQAAGQVSALLKTVPQVSAVQVAGSAEAPVVRVDLDFNRLALVGLSAADVLDTVQAAFAGETVARIYNGPRILDVAVIAQESLRQDPEAVGDLLLRSSSGFSVPLKSVANVYLTDGRAEIDHDGGLRRELLTASARSGDVDGLEKAARALIAQKARLPPGVFLDFRAINSAARTDRDLGLAYGFGVFALFGVLAIAFDARGAALILASAFFAMAGGALAAALMGGVLSIGVTAGLLTLVGLSIRSGALFVSRVEDIVLRGGAPFDLQTVTQAARDRLSPLLASATLIVLALGPLAIDLNAAGHEIVGPMAVVVVFGVITGTAGTLLILPPLTAAFWRPRTPGAETP